MTGLRERRKLGTRRALEDAALRLFARDGFDETPVEAIAAEAGVSARTFFRYFATKDEVLYGHREDRQGVLHEAVVAAPASTSALDALHLGLLAIAPTFDREQTRLQERAVARSPVLRGRQAEVTVSWELAMAAALAARDEANADVVAAVGMAAFRAAVVRWLRDDRPLAEHLDEVRQIVKRSRRPST